MLKDKGPLLLPLFSTTLKGHPDSRVPTMLDFNLSICPNRLVLSIHFGKFSAIPFFEYLSLLFCQFFPPLKIHYIRLYYGHHVYDCFSFIFFYFFFHQNNYWLTVFTKTSILLLSKRLFTKNYMFSIANSLEPIPNYYSKLNKNY